MAALRPLAAQEKLAVAEPSPAADQNAFAVTTTFAQEHGLKTLSEFGQKCAGLASVLGGPPECPRRPQCQVGLEETYDARFGRFVALDAGGPQTKTALRTGRITLGLVLSSDAVLSVVKD
jgi:osmoprotectant transport system substrate-binding protein